MAQTVDLSYYSGGMLAYLGDASYELLVREHIMKTCRTKAGKMHKAAQPYVGAVGQAGALAAITDFLNQEEMAYVKLGRNSKLTVSKKNNPADHTAASGLEALFGYLFLTGQDARAREIFGKIVEHVGSLQGTKQA